MVSACCQQRAYDGHVLGSLVVPAEEIILAPERDGADYAAMLP